jgi:predicted transposase/invertase (TIGR01784 family)
VLGLKPKRGKRPIAHRLKPKAIEGHLIFQFSLAYLSILEFLHYFYFMKRDDSLWKAILEDVFDDLLAFFYPNSLDLFDFDKGFEFLDKELDDLFPREESESIRYVDKLVKVTLKDGNEKWFLVHIEVQGYRDKTFEERMFTYYYRIKDKYQREITAWAILTDQFKSYKPVAFKSDFLGTSLTYHFNTFKILEQDQKILESSNNPFAIVVLTVHLALKAKKLDQNQLIDLKMAIVRNLLRKGIPKKKIDALLNFIQYYVRLNPSSNIIFKNKLQELTGKTYPMGIEQFLLERERKIGEKKGIEKGIDLGIEKAMKKAILNGYNKGLSIAMICNINELSEEYVLKVLRENGRID